MACEICTRTYNSEFFDSIVYADSVNSNRLLHSTDTSDMG